MKSANLLSFILYLSLVTGHKIAAQKIDFLKEENTTKYALSFTLGHLGAYSGYGLGFEYYPMKLIETNMGMVFNSYNGITTSIGCQVAPLKLALLSPYIGFNFIPAPGRSTFAESYGDNPIGYYHTPPNNYYIPQLGIRLNGKIFAFEIAIDYQIAQYKRLAIFDYGVYNPVDENTINNNISGGLGWTLSLFFHIGKFPTKPPTSPFYSH